MTFDPARHQLPKLIAALAAALLAHGSARGQQPQLDWQHIGNRELATALCGGFDPAETGLGFRTARIPMFRMLPGFLSDAGSVVSGDEAPGSDGSAGILVNFGDDNPYFDPRRPGDPGGVGFIRLYSQLQLLDTGTTSVCLGLRAWAPAGLENGGVADGRSMLAPGLGVFQDLGNNAGLHGYVGQQIRADLRNSNQATMECGMAMHCPVPGLVEPTSHGVYFFVQALGRYGVSNPGDGREMGWEFVPGVHWRLSDNFWMSLGASRRGMFTCSWQF